MGEFGNTRKLDRHGGWVSGSTGPVEKVGTGEQIILQFLFLYEICKRHPLEALVGYTLLSCQVQRL